MRNGYPWLRFVSPYALMLRAPEGDPPPSPPPPPPPPPAVPETFSREYVTEIRNEARGYRLSRDNEKTRADKAEADKLQAEKDRDEQVAAAKTSADQRVMRSELKAAAVAAGMIDLDGLAFVDMSKLKLNDNGDLEGVEDALKALKEAKPYLFGSGTGTSGTQKPPAPANPEKKSAKDMSPEEWGREKKRLGV